MCSNCMEHLNILCLTGEKFLQIYSGRISLSAWPPFSPLAQPITLKQMGKQKGSTSV